MSGSGDEMTAFRGLQANLAARWALAEGDGPEPRDIVVVPSLSFDGIDRVSIDGVIHYEERMLFALNLLRRPRARLVYVTSAPIHPAAVDYMLSLVSGIPNEHMRGRLTVLSLYDSTLVPLTQKILQRPRVIERIRHLIRPECGMMTCFTVTEAERSLAVALGVPLYGVDPDLCWLGTKSGSRWAFREAGVSLLPGAEDLKSETALVEAIDGLWEESDGLERMVVKQNTGFSGQGNAILDLKALDSVSPKSAASRGAREQALADALPKMRFVDPRQTWDTFKEKFEREGGIVEAFLEKKDKRATSCQIRISPEGNLDAISTHDQLVEGVDGQIYAGCRFPSDAAYRMDIQRDALRVGELLQDKGVVGRLAVDFLCVQADDGSWRHHAIETNLRLGGTTHPMMLLRMMTDGRYDPDTGLYLTPRDEPQFYVATDSMRSDSYRGLLVEDLLDIAAVDGLHYQTWSESGVLFHFTGALSEFGKLGITAVGKSPDEADHWFERTRQVLDRETKG
ncbi:MAG: carboxylate-amine ligase [Deltaproteobacteria bacterium]|nr:carboxylate-amine ligase [Deltaproteobacteria bacterium]MBW2719664.1 carboxylate-amine ligase [Deltaproteobacteria bacterium]